MKRKISLPLDRQALRALLREFRRNDWQVLDDAALQAALDGTHPLSRREWEALLDSPQTLRRLLVLKSKRSPQAEAAHAANDNTWHVSPGLLRAAASGDAAATLGTDDGYWQLAFPRAQNGWWMVLRLDPAAPFAAEFFAGEASAGEVRRETGQPEVAVVDGLGRTLSIGPLDEEGKLLARWPHTKPPLVALAEAGGGFQVLRV